MAQALWVDKGAQPWYRRHRIRTEGPSPFVLPQRSMTRRGNAARVITRFPRSNVCRPAP